MSRERFSITTALLFAGLAAWLNASIATAQEAEPSHADLQTAIAAFNQGQRAQLSGDHAQAAEMFELAFQTAPAPEALRAALRNHVAAGNSVRGATLALLLQERYSDDADSSALARSVLAESAPGLYRVTVHCQPACTLAVDGGGVTDGMDETAMFFVAPNARELAITWTDRPSLTEPLEAVAGGSAELSFEAPAAASGTASEAPQADSSEGMAEAELSGLPPTFFAVGLAVTAVAGSIATGFAVDTFLANEDYIATPTREGYEDGVGRELRTNLMFVGVGVAGVVTALLLAFTDFGEDSVGPSACVDPVNETATFGARGTW